MNITVQTAQGLVASRNVTTSQNFVLITSQLKNQIDARIKSTAIRRPANCRKFFMRSARS